jgi:hypothetical protein
MLTRLAKTAGARCSIEGAFESGMQDVGLADYEVRSWTGRHRHVTLSPAGPRRPRRSPEAGRPASPKKTAQHPELIDLSSPEVCRLLVCLLCSRLSDAGEVLAWSQWRRFVWQVG